jgi:hypothetical protein
VFSAIIGILYLASPTLFGAALAAMFLFPLIGFLILLPVLAIVGLMAEILTALIRGWLSPKGK